jgi:membrane associated rhomboid family serine protease
MIKAKDIWNNILWRLIAINVAVFLLVHIAVLLGVSQYTVSEHTALPANPILGVTHIYTAVVYMFTQWQFVHLLFNMLWLWCFGSILLRYGENQKVVLSAYLIGGFAGAACFMALGALKLIDGVLIGSSAAVLAVMATCGVRLAHRRVELMLFGSVEVRWLSVGVIAFTVIVDATGAGFWHIGPHLAGAVAGAVYALLLTRKQRTVAKSLQNYNPQNRKYAKVRRPAQRGLDATEQAELDALLAKVKASGYNSLNSNDKTRLFQLSNKIK